MNERLTRAPLYVSPIEPLNCLPCAVFGSCQVQLAVPRAVTERCEGDSRWPASLPAQHVVKLAGGQQLADPAQSHEP